MSGKTVGTAATLIGWSHCSLSALRVRLDRPRPERMQSISTADDRPGLRGNWTVSVTSVTARTAI